MLILFTFINIESSRELAHLCLLETPYVLNPLCPSVFSHCKTITGVSFCPVRAVGGPIRESPRAPTAAGMPCGRRDAEKYPAVLNQSALVPQSAPRHTTTAASRSTNIAPAHPATPEPCPAPKP